MNDRYMFRGLDISTGALVYGNYVFCRNKHCILTHDDIGGFDERLIEWVEVSYETIGQCTGLKDKNGVLIFEGDLLEDETGVGEVKWLMEDCKFVVRTIKPQHEYHNLESDGQLKKTEIIGTIHTHPELLEED